MHMNFTQVFFCVCSLIIGMALVALVWFLFAWALEKLFGTSIPAQIQNVLIVIAIVLMIAGLVDCVLGGGHLMLFPR
jgi:small-conductance mechanosensitive channel